MKQTLQFADRPRITALFCVLTLIAGLSWITSDVSSKNANNETPQAVVSIKSSGVQGSDSLRRYGALPIPANNDSSDNSTPRAAVAADFDRDGVSDLLVAHNDKLVLHRGNLNAFAPQTQEAWEAIRDGLFVSPFEEKTRSTIVSTAADFLLSGDFNRDTRLDVAIAARGDSVFYVLLGDGAGNFPEVRRIETAGLITALASGDVNRADGLPDLIIGTRNADGFALQVFSGLGDIFASGSLLYQLSSPAEAIAVGQLNENEFNDIAIGTESEIFVLSGADTTRAESAPPAEMLRLAQRGSVKSIVAGDFLPDRDNRIELAVLSSEGMLRIFKRGSLDRRPISMNEHLAEQVRDYRSKGYPVPERILERLNKDDLREPSPRPQGDVINWTEAETISAAAPNLRLSPQSVLTTGRISDGVVEDLIVLDQSNRVLVIPFQLDYSGIDQQNTYLSFEGKRAVQDFNANGSPVAALALKLNFDNDQDLLVLQEGSSEPSAFVSAPQATFTVTTAVDDIDSSVGNGVCSGPSGCTLRAAIMEANRLPGDDTIMINAGINPTISRGQPDNDGQGTNDQANGDLDITCRITNPAAGACDLPLSTNDNDLSIIGAAGGNTVSAGTFSPYPVNGGGSINTDRVFDVGQDGIFGGAFGGSTGVSATFTNLTIQNGNVREALNTGLGGGNYAYGGGIRYDGFRSGGGHGTLTLTNTTINNNQSDNAGGGVYQVYGTFNASGSTFSTNITKAGEGGGLFFGAATSASNVNISNSTFSANEARQGIVFGTFTANADGGGLRINADPNTVTIGTTNFTNNIAQQDGGAIKTLGALVTVTGGTMTGNTARRHGGVAFGDEDTANSPAFVTFSGSTMRNNTANSDNAIFAGDGSAGDGGAIFRDRGTLNITNTIIGGTGVGEPNTATNGGGVAHAFTVDSAAGNDSNQTIVTINGGSINGNIANTDGGGVYHNAALFDVTASVLNIGQTTATALTGNKAKNNGGGIHVSNSATASLNNMTLRSNQANSDNSGGGDGGALYQNIGATTFTGTLTIGGVGFPNSAVNGGGISNAAGTLVLPNGSSITDNSASGNGGGINNAGNITATGTTISNNSAATNGGGIFVTGGTSTFDGTTLTNNSAPNGNGARLTGGTTNLNNATSISNNLDIAGGTLNFNAGTKTIGGNFTFSSGTVNAGSSTVNLAGNFAYTAGGTFTAGTSTFNFNGTVPQTISGAVTFNNLTINNASGVTLQSSETVGGALTLTAGTLAVGSNTLTLNGAVSATGGSLTSATNGTVNYNQSSNGQNVLIANYGNLTFSNFNKTLPNSGTIGIAGTFSPGTAVGHTTTGSTIIFNGAATQTIPVFNYNNLTLNNPAGATLGGSTTIGGAFTLQSGNLAIGTNTLTLNGAVTTSGGTFSSAATGTVNYNQASNGQTVLSGNYGNLTFSNSTKDLTNATIGIAGTFSPGTAVGHTITGSTFIFNGTTAQTLPSGFTTYNNLTLNNPAGVTGFSGLTVQGLLRVQQGTFNSSSTYNNVQIDSGATLAGTNATTINVSGNWTNNGTFTANGNTVNFNGTAAQNIGGSSATTFNNLTINNAMGVNANSNITVGGALTLTAGTLAVGSNTLTLNGAVSATGGSLTSATNGTVNYNQSSNGQNVLIANYGNLTFSNFNKTLPNSGTIGIAGTFSPGTAVGHTITGSTINFNGTGAQTIPAFNYFNLTSSDAGARTLANGGIIRIAGTFAPGTNVYTITGSTVEYNGTTAQPLPSSFTTYNNLTLNNPAGVTGFSGLTVQGLLRIATGSFSSNNGTYNNVQIDATTTLTGTNSTTINVSGNWTNNGTFINNGNALNFNGSVLQTISGSSASTFNNLTINNTAGVNLGANATVGGALTLTTGTLGVGTNSLTLNGAVSATSGGLSSSATGTVNYNQGIDGQNVLAANYGNLTFSNFNKVLADTGTIGIAGTFSPGTAAGHTITGSTIDFNGAGAQTIPAFTFNNLSTSGGGTKTLGGIANVLGGLTIGNATTLSVSASNFALNVGGNFTNNGTFTPQAGTVTFNGATAQTIGGTSATNFSGLTVNNAAGLTFSFNSTITGTLTLADGIINTGANTLTLSATATNVRGVGCAPTTCFVASSPTSGGVTKQFAGAVPGFTFHLGTTGGTDDGYTPVALANVNAAAGNSLTVRAVDMPSPASISSPKISRYWELTEVGSITTDLTFTYLDGDDNSITNPTRLRVFRDSINVCSTDCVDETALTATVNGVSAFSPWTIAEATPSAASTTVGGRVFNSQGRPIARAVVSMTDANGVVRSVQTNPFGYYRFEEVSVGATYTFSVEHKRSVFAPQVVTVREKAMDLDFSAQP